jgi:CheY-like chemotaxis protein
MSPTKPLLLVEDNSDDVMILQRAFKDAGVDQELIHLPDAEEALAYLRSPTHPRPALVLLDLNLPGMSGVEFLKAIKVDPTLNEIPVVVLSTSDQRRDILDSFDLSVAGYIVKPMDYSALVETVKVIQDYWALNLLPVSDH